jgi:hypothetical protein
MVVERAVKYSERDRKGEVSYRGLKRAFEEMKVALRVTENDVKRIQRPERILAELQSTGTPSEKRIGEEIASLQKRMKINRDWLIRSRGKIERSKDLVSKMEQALRG